VAQAELHHAKPYKDKSDNYLTVLPALLAKRVRFNDDPVLRNQLTALERKPGVSKETVGHPSHAGAHDDVSDAVCGAVATLLRRAAVDDSVPMPMPFIAIGGSSWADHLPGGSCFSADPGKVVGVPEPPPPAPAPSAPAPSAPAASTPAPSPAPPLPPGAADFEHMRKVNERARPPRHYLKQPSPWGW
jgi:hypothetical protein